MLVKVSGKFYGEFYGKSWRMHIQCVPGPLSSLFKGPGDKAICRPDQRLAPSMMMTSCFVSVLIHSCISVHAVHTYMPCMHLIGVDYTTIIT